jgi:L,D-peptidoglycan transpeptidase YkuD (ErfK/YbiS/YcfS/YnhG family)
VFGEDRLDEPFDEEGDIMHTTSARILAMVITAVLSAAGLTVIGQTDPAEAAAKYCTGVEANSSVTAAKAIEVKQRSTITADIYLCKKSGDRYVRDSGPYKARLGYNGTTSSKAGRRRQDPEAVCSGCAMASAPAKNPGPGQAVDEGHPRSRLGRR